MPRYFFPIADNDHVIFDEEGLVLPNLEAAIREAKHGAFDMLNDAIAAGDDIGHQVICITDTLGKELARVRLTEATVRAVPTKASSTTPLN